MSTSGSTGGRSRTSAFFLRDGGQHTCCTRDRGLHQAQQLRQQHLFGRDACQLLHAVHVQGFSTVRTATNHQFVIGFRELGHHLGGGDGVGEVYEKGKLVGTASITFGTIGLQAGAFVQIQGHLSSSRTPSAVLFDP